MINKRIIGVVTIKDDWAVQSFSYNKYLPLGRPTVLAQNFDRWGADEILITCIDRVSKGPNLQLLETLANSGISTPIIYGGGIRSQKDAINAIKAGADRISIDSGWNIKSDELLRVHETIGAQAVIASIPMHFENNMLKAYDYLSKKSVDLPEPLLISIKNKYLSEIIVIDHLSEGTSKNFNCELIKQFPIEFPKLIAFGGIHTHKVARAILSHTNCIAIGIGNYLSYKEHAIQKYKENLYDLGVRESQYYPFKTEKPIYAPDL